MENDDMLVGRILSRREALALLGAAGAAVLAACAPGQTPTTQSSTTNPATPSGLYPESQTAVAMGGTPTAQASVQAPVATAVAANVTTLPSCVVRPELTEGPYYVDEALNRSDVRSDPSTGSAKPGVPLVLTFNVSRVNGSGCTPLEGAKVEIWHCDAAGIYSDVSDPGFNTRGQKFLRGYQMTDAKGQATFTTIYPGWYQGRTVHIHFKVHPDTNSVFTSQLFFDDALSDQVFSQAPYASKGTRNVRNTNDNIFSDQMVLAVDKSGEGYTTAFNIGVQTSQYTAR
jgi:protocatechuate 3,4-dioxygenase beta subunit